MDGITWAPAPAGHEGETGSHIADAAASPHFTTYRTPDGWTWQSQEDGGSVVRSPAGIRINVQEHGRLYPELIDRARSVVRAARELKERYPTLHAPDPELAAYLDRHDALMRRMDDPDSDL